MRSQIGIVAALSIALVLPGVITGQQRAATLAPPRWTVGDTWTFSGVMFRGTDTYTVMAMSRSGYLVQLRTPVGASTLPFTLGLDTPSFWWTVPAWPMVIGGPSWKVRRTMVTDDRVHVLTDRAVGWETVRVPAGTFTAVHVHGEDCEPHFDVCGAFDWWYAPAVKWYVKQAWSNTIYWAPAYRGRTAALVTYHLVGP